MRVSRTAKTHSKRNEVIIAIIGLVGVLVTGVLSNWDKLFPKDNLVQATYSGYRPTGNFETELRYYFEVSGVRTMLEAMQEQLTQRTKADLVSKFPERARTINTVFDAVTKEAIRLEEVIQELLPVYQKHFSLNEIQELNKFYSTEVMQGMVKKMPLVTQDAAPLQVKLMNAYLQRFEERLKVELGTID